MSASAKAGTLRTRPRRRLRLEISGPAFLFGFGALFVALAILVLVTKGPTTAANEVIAGLQRGAIYALIAVGYTLVYGIIELINFAHGDIFTLSAFYSIFWVGALQHFGLNLDSLASSGFGGLALTFVILFPLTMIAAGLTGVLLERVAYRRLRDAPKLAPLITAIGASFFLEGLMFAFFIPPAPPGFGGSQGAIGGDYPTGEAGWITGTPIQWGGVVISWKDIFVVVVALVAMFALQLFIRYTRLGKAMRASAQDRDAALLCGININRTIAATFFIGSALAAVAGIVYATHYATIKWNLGFRIGIIAFTAAVLGGIGNIVGAGIGGFVIGLIEAFSAVLIPNGGAWANSIVFAVLILVLTLRPTGLLGMQVPDRA